MLLDILVEKILINIIELVVVPGLGLHFNRSGFVTSWPGIAVQPGSAHFPTKNMNLDLFYNLHALTVRACKSPIRVIRSI